MKRKEERHYQPLIRPNEDVIGNLAQSFEALQQRFLTFVQTQEIVLDPAVNERFNSRAKDIEWEVLLFKKRLHDLYKKHGIEVRSTPDRRSGLRERRT